MDNRRTIIRYLEQNMISIQAEVHRRDKIYVLFQTDKGKSVFLCIGIHDKSDIPIIPGKTFIKKVCHSMSFGNEIILHVCKLSFNFSIPTKCTTIIILQ